jgi:hypothetical protein
MQIDSGDEYLVANTLSLRRKPRRGLVLATVLLQRTPRRRGRCCISLTPHRAFAQSLRVQRFLLSSESARTGSHNLPDTALLRRKSPGDSSQRSRIGHGRAKRRVFSIARAMRERSRFGKATPRSRASPPCAVSARLANRAPGSLPRIERAPLVLALRLRRARARRERFMETSRRREVRPPTRARRELSAQFAKCTWQYYSGRGN